MNLSKRAELSTNKVNKRMISKFKRRYKVEDFHVGQHVMVKVQNKFHKIAPKKRLFYCVNTSYTTDNCFTGRRDRSRQTTEKVTLY